MLKRKPREGCLALRARAFLLNRAERFLRVSLHAFGSEGFHNPIDYPLSNGEAFVLLGELARLRALVGKRRAKITG